MIGRKKHLAKPLIPLLGGNKLPWVAAATHLVHELHESGSSKVLCGDLYDDS